MSRYKAYPAYKDSGVACLGRIPPHWAISKLRYKFSFGKGLTITKENLVEDGIPCVNYGEVHSKFGFEVNPTKHSLKCVDESYLKAFSNCLLSKGDFVFADTSEDLDGSGNFTQLTSDTFTFAGYHTIIARPESRKNTRYLAYLFDAKEFRTQIRLAVKGVKVFSITQAILRGADIWLPSEDEQKNIAAFLDHETAKIDALIEKQQRLIELLKEKRQAVISHAVTKGLNPNAPMKDSGVEWLGEVPEHWDIKRISYVSQLRSGDAIVSDQIEAEGDYPVYGGNGLRGYCPNFNLDGNFILIGRQGALCGNINYGSGRFWASEHAIVVYPSLDLDVKWFGEALRAMNLNQYNVSAAQPGLAVANIVCLKIPFHPKKEQELIAAFLDHETAKIDTLIEKQQRLIELAQERRTALISAAVTGKIDVRDWQPAAAQAVVGVAC